MLLRWLLTECALLVLQLVLVDLHRRGLLWDRRLSGSVRDLRLRRWRLHVLLWCECLRGSIRDLRLRSWRLRVLLGRRRLDLLYGRRRLDLLSVRVTLPRLYVQCLQTSDHAIHRLLRLPTVGRCGRGSSACLTLLVRRGLLKILLSSLNRRVGVLEGRCRGGLLPRHRRRRWWRFELKLLRGRLSDEGLRRGALIPEVRPHNVILLSAPEGFGDLLGLVCVEAHTVIALQLS